MGCVCHEASMWAAESGIWAVHHIFVFYTLLGGALTAARPVPKSSTLLHEMLTASSLLSCMCSVIVNKDVIMPRQPPLPLPRESQEEWMKTPCLQMRDHFENHQVLLVMQFWVFFFHILNRFLVLFWTWKSKTFGSISQVTIIFLKHFKFITIMYHNSFMNSSQFN